MTGAEMVAEFRRDAGITQLELADMLGRSRTWVHQVERGDIFITPRLICEMADVLGPSIIHPLLEKACEEWLGRQGIEATVKVHQEAASAEV
jgi:transcriptional regulator with XRE-family HTH domain